MNNKYVIIQGYIYINIFFKKKYKFFNLNMNIILFFLKKIIFKIKKINNSKNKIKFFLIKKFKKILCQ